MQHDFWCEFSVEMARKYGVEIAIIHGFFIKYRYLANMQDSNDDSYPSLKTCMSVLKFWDEDKIRTLISDLYLNKLI